jgi:hypothetical protein
MQRQAELAHGVMGLGMRSLKAFMLRQLAFQGGNDALERIPKVPYRLVQRDGFTSAIEAPRRLSHPTITEQMERMERQEHRTSYIFPQAYCLIFLLSPGGVFPSPVTHIILGVPTE